MVFPSKYRSTMRDRRRRARDGCVCRGSRRPRGTPGRRHAASGGDVRALPRQQVLRPSGPSACRCEVLGGEPAGRQQLEVVVDTALRTSCQPPSASFQASSSGPPPRRRFRARTISRTWSVDDGLVAILAALGAYSNTTASPSMLTCSLRIVARPYVYVRLGVRRRRCGRSRGRAVAPRMPSRDRVAARLGEVFGDTAGGSSGSSSASSSTLSCLARSRLMRTGWW